MILIMIMGIIQMIKIWNKIKNKIKLKRLKIKLKLKVKKNQKLLNNFD